MPFFPSGDVPDVFLGGAITDADISAYPELFLPLNDYVEEQAPNVMRMFEEKPDTKNAGRFYGREYLWASLGEVPQAGQHLHDDD